MSVHTPAKGSAPGQRYDGRITADYALDRARARLRRDSILVSRRLDQLQADVPSQTLRSGDFEGSECTLAWRRSRSSIPSRRPASHSPLEIGAVFGDRYRVANKVGSVKAMLSCGHDDEELPVRFVREAQLLARVRSDYVSRVVDFVHDTRFGPLLIMEFIEGPSLADVLRGRSLTVEDAIDLGIDIGRALCELHRARIVHRDIKPQNVILQPISPDRTRAVIVEFGVSRVLARSDEEQTSITLVGASMSKIQSLARSGEVL